MKCPECNTAIDFVSVTSKCYQYADVNADGKIVGEYSFVKEILDVIDFRCSNCDKVIEVTE